MINEELPALLHSAISLITMAGSKAARRAVPEDGWTVIGKITMGQKSVSTFDFDGSIVRILGSALS